MSTDCLDHPIHRLFDAAISAPQRFSSAGELEERLDQFGHLVNGNADFLVKLLALICGQAAFAQKFGVGDDSSEGVAKVVRNRTCHTPDRGQPFGFQQLLLGLQ